MPKTPIDYSKGLIYSIICKTDETLIYIGSTTNFTKRKNTHKAVCHNEKLRQHNYKVYVMIRANGGWDNFNIIPVKEYACENNIQLVIEEERIRKEMKANLNAQRAFRTEEEDKEYYRNYYEANTIELKEYHRNYRETHAEELKEGKQKYYQEHLAEVKEANRKYRQEHKAEIKEQKRKYREEHLAEIKEQKRKYRQEHPAEVKEATRKYQQEHKAEVKEATLKYQQEHKAELKEYHKKYAHKNKEEINKKRREKRLAKKLSSATIV